MGLAHEPLLRLARQALAAGGGARGRRLRVLDLGCGNGTLVAKIARLDARVVPAGIDVAAHKIDRARQLLPEFAAEFTVANLFDPRALGPSGPRAYLALLMLGRLIEVRAECARAVLRRLRRRARYLLVYAYEDYVRETMPLTAMAARVGLRLLGPAPRDNVSFARLGGAGFPSGPRPHDGRGAGGRR
jgi:SAM-dependent methyltransferase